MFGVATSFLMSQQRGLKWCHDTAGRNWCRGMDLLSRHGWPSWRRDMVSVSQQGRACGHAAAHAQHVACAHDLSAVHVT